MKDDRDDKDCVVIDEEENINSVTEGLNSKRIPDIDEACCSTG